MPERELLPGEMAVLALLTLRPMHGYDMARYFREDLAEVVPIEQSLLYSYVRNVEERGCVTWAEERVGLRPPRKTYSLTPVGRALVDGWLDRPAARMREVRFEFLVKLYVLHRTSPGRERDLVARQLDVCEAYRDRLAEVATGAEGFARLVARSKLSAAESVAGWLRGYAEELRAIAAEAP